MSYCREEFSALGNLSYLNNASFGPRPSSAQLAMDKYTDRLAAGYIDHTEMFAVIRECRELVAQLLSVSSKFISLSGNTSTGLNYVASSFPFEDGDNILILDKQFPSGVYPYLNQRERGVKCRFIPADPYPDLNRVIELIDERTKIVAISWVRFFDGYKINLKEWADAIHESGAYLIVDGMQGCGAMPLDLSETGVDAFSAGGAKWLLSPLGCGILYVAPGLRDILSPIFAGWLQMIEPESDDFGSMLDYDLRIPDDGRIFEVGTYPVASLYGFRKSLQLLLSIGTQNISGHIFRLLDKIIDAVSDNPQIEIASCLDVAARSGILSLKTPISREIVDIMGEDNVTISYREGLLRISPHLYNSTDDIDKFLFVLSRTINKNRDIS